MDQLGLTPLSWTSQLDLSAGPLSWTFQLDLSAGPLSWTSQLDLSAGPHRGFQSFGQDWIFLYKYFVTGEDYKVFFLFPAIYECCHLSSLSDLYFAKNCIIKTLPVCDRKEIVKSLCWQRFSAWDNEAACE